MYFESHTRESVPCYLLTLVLVCGLLCVGVCVSSKWKTLDQPVVDEEDLAEAEGGVVAAGGGEGAGAESQKTKRYILNFV